MAAPAGDNKATMEIANEKASKWRTRFKRCLSCCGQSNANLAEEDPNLAEEGAQNADVDHQLVITLEHLDNLLADIKVKIERLRTATASSNSTTSAGSSSSSYKYMSAASSSSSYSEEIISSYNMASYSKRIISSYMSSFTNVDSRREGAPWLKVLVKRALGGAGGVHWLGFGLSLIAWTLDNMDATVQNRDDCIQILEQIVFLLSNSKDIWEASSEDDIKTIETLQDTVSKAFRCAIVCSSYLNNAYFLRFLEAPSAKDAVASLKEDLGFAVEALNQYLITRSFHHMAPKTEPQYSDSDDDDSVGGSVLKEKALQYLQEDLDNTKALCLHGMGGVGKSTLGVSILKSFQGMKSYRYCRVELPFGIKYEQLPTIQNEILEKACCTTATVSNPREGKEKLKEELKKINGRIFLYMDNVLGSGHLGELLPKASCFPRGSRILVTTRHESVYNSILDDLKLESSKLIEVRKWEEERAKKFLRKQIFRGKNEEVGGSLYPGELEKRVLALCDGLPLALKVVGRYIRNDGRDPTMHPQVWKEVEEAMKEAKSLDGSAEDELYHRLMFSLTALDKDSKRAFLDVIAFGIRRSWETVEPMVVGGHRHLEGLRKRALVEKRSPSKVHQHWERRRSKLSVFLHFLAKSKYEWDFDEQEECVEVHDVLKEMGKKMVAEDKDEVRITGQEDLEKIKSDSLANVVGLKNVRVKARQLKQMPRLRVLDNVEIEGESQETVQLDHLLVVRGLNRMITFGSKLKELSIRRPFSRERNASTLNLEVLKVCHELEFLVLEWDGLENVDVIQAMTCLKELSLAGCKRLQSLPEGISNLSKLKKLMVLECSNLQSVPEAISGLKDLMDLHLSSCTSLQSLPAGVSCLTSLRLLNLSDCSGLLSIPKDIGSLPGLKILDLSSCESLQDLPEEIVHLTTLTKLDLYGCKGLQSLPKGLGGMTGLTKLYLTGCIDLKSLPEGVESLTGLLELDLLGCESLRSLPKELSKLEGLRCAPSLLN